MPSYNFETIHLLLFLVLICFCGSESPSNSSLISLMDVLCPDAMLGMLGVHIFPCRIQIQKSFTMFWDRNLEVIYGDLLFKFSTLKVFI